MVVEEGVGVVSPQSLLPVFALILAVLMAADGKAAPPPRVDRDGEPLPPGALARLGTLRYRGVRGALTFTPDGKLLAAGTGPSGARITFWDPSTGRPVRHLEAQATLSQLAFTPDGRRVVCFSYSSRTPVLDAVSGKELFIVNGVHGALSADGTMLVNGDVAGEPPQVHLWDAATGQRLGQWPIAKGLTELALAPDNRTLALIDESEPGVVQIRDLRTGSKRGRLDIEATQCRVAFSPDSKTLVTAQRSGVTLWDTASGKKLRAWSEAADCRPVFSSDGSLAWIGRGRLGGFCPYVAHPGAEAPTVLTEPRPIARPASYATASPCFTPDGKALVVLTEGGALEIRDIASGKETLAAEAHASGVFGLALTPDGRHVVSRDGLELIVWAIDGGRLVRRIPTRLSEHELLTALLPDGQLLTEDRTANPLHGLFRVRDPLSGSELLRFEGRPDVGPPHATVAPGARFAALRGRAGEMCVIDLRDYRCTYRHNPQAAGFGMFLAHDGDVLASYTRADIEMHVRRQSTGAVVCTRLPQDSQLERWLGNHNGVSPDCHWLVAPAEDGRLRRWDLFAGKELEPLPEAQRAVWSLHWSPDSRLVAVYGSQRQPWVIDRGARQHTLCWDPTTGKRVPHLDLPDDQSWQLFSLDGRTLFTTNSTGVTLWEVATGRERHRLPSPANVVALSDDGRTLVTGSSDTQVLIWDATGRTPGPVPSAEQLESAWSALGEDDSKAAYAALWQLAAAPEAAVQLLQQRLRPVSLRPDPEQLKRLVARLESDDFADRQRAASELEKHGELAAPLLLQSRQGSLSLEAQRRIDSVLGKLDAHRLVGEPLRSLRAVEILERIGSPAARRLLETLAAGTAEARLTREAAAALQRLAWRSERRDR